MALNKSVEKSIKILELIAKHPEGVSLSFIYKELNLPQSTVYDILQALYKDDCIYYKNRELKTYVIGSKVFAIGQSYNKYSNYIDYCKPLFESFSNKYNANAYALKRLDDKTVNVYKYIPKDSKLRDNEDDIYSKLSTSIGGKVFLAYETESIRNKLLKSILKNDFKGDKQELSLLEETINKIKNSGYLKEEDAHTISVACPIFNFENEIRGVILYSRLKDDVLDKNIDKELNEFIEISKTVSKLEGYKN